MQIRVDRQECIQAKPWVYKATSSLWACKGTPCLGSTGGNNDLTALYVSEDVSLCVTPSVIFYLSRFLQILENQGSTSQALLLVQLWVCWGMAMSTSICLLTCSHDLQMIASLSFFFPGRKWFSAQAKAKCNHTGTFWLLKKKKNEAAIFFSD